jgi:membrane protein
VSLSGLRQAGRALWRATFNFDRDGAFDKAAVISYFALLSLLPLTILLVSLGAFLLGSTDEAVRGARFLLRDLVSRLGPDAFAQARQVGEQAADFGWPFILLALWTASKVFNEIEAALDLVFQVEKRRSYPVRKILAFGLVALLALALVVVVAGTSAVAVLNRFLDNTPLAGGVRDNPLYQWLTGTFTRFVFPWLLAVFSFAFVYKVLPARTVERRPAALAGLVAGSLWEGLKHGFSFYLARFAEYGRTYGVLEAVVVFAIWVNLSAIVLIWGGELAAVLAGARDGQPQTTG